MDLHHQDAGIFSSLSVISSIIAWFALKDAQSILAIIASLIAIGSGIMAMRYYHYATKEKRGKK